MPVHHMSHRGMSEGTTKKMRGKGKVHKVMSEFKHGELMSSIGSKVTKRSQAIAIAMSEAGLSKKKKSRRR